MQFFKRFSFSFAVFFALLCAGAVAAWTGPTAGPPNNGTVAAPVNLGSSFQDKTGSVWFDGGVGIDAGKKYCIGSSCITNWSDAGGAASQWTSGTGLIYYTGGNVGIGTTNPTHTLEVNGSLAAPYGTNGLYSTSGAGGAYGATIWSMDTGYQGSAAGASYTTPTNYGLAWLRPSNANTNSNVGEGLYGYSGKVLQFGFGSTGGYLSGNFVVDGYYFGSTADSSTHPSYTWSADSNSGMFDAGADSIGFTTAGAERVRITSTGSVGIGLTAPAQKLSVAGNVQVTGTGNGIIFSDGTKQTSAASGSGTLTGSGSANYLSKFTAATAIGNSLIYDNGTNVGIGTAAPTQKLTVAGSILSTAGQIFGSVTDSATLPSYSWSTDTNAGMFNAAADTVGFTTGGVERMRISSTGNVGIGMTPAAGNKLDVSGTVRATSFIYSSDERLKHNVETLGGALSKVLALRGVTFVWNDGTHKAGQEDIGFIAQEVERVAPELVQTGGDGYEAVDYARVAPLLVNAIHEQQAQIDAQQKQIDYLKARLDALAR